MTQSDVLFYGDVLKHFDLITMYTCMVILHFMICILQDHDFFQHLEMHMRSEFPPLCGRDHLSYRSYYYPVKVSFLWICLLYSLVLITPTVTRFWLSIMYSIIPLHSILWHFFHYFVIPSWSTEWLHTTIYFRLGKIFIISNLLCQGWKQRQSKI